MPLTGSSPQHPSCAGLDLHGLVPQLLEFAGDCRTLGKTPHRQQPTTPLVRRPGPARAGAAAAGVCGRLPDAGHRGAPGLGHRKVHDPRAAGGRAPPLQRPRLPLPHQGGGHPPGSAAGAPRGVQLAVLRHGCLWSSPWPVRCGRRAPPPAPAATRLHGWHTWRVSSW